MRAADDVVSGTGYVVLVTSIAAYVTDLLNSDASAVIKVCQFIDDNLYGRSVCVTSSIMPRRRVDYADVADRSLAALRYMHHADDAAIVAGWAEVRQ